MTDHTDNSSPTNPDDRGGDDELQFSAENGDAFDPSDCTPLEPWLATLARESLEMEAPENHAVPRELMWARIRQQRRLAAGVATPAAGIAAVVVDRPHAARSDDVRMQGFTMAPARKRFRAGFRVERATVSRLLAIAATLVVGVAIGRYAMPGAGTTPSPVANTASESLAAAAALATSATNAQAAQARATAPAVVAMGEHLARTVSLLDAVRNERPDARPAADVSAWAQELLGTTRLLLDEPTIADDRTRRLLQDLELVLVQIIQARGTSAPEARRAPNETMRETNLLPRVRAAVTASIAVEESSFRGIAE